MTMTALDERTGASRHRGGYILRQSLLATFLLAHASLLATAAAADQQIKCAGWAGGKQMRTLPASAINDGYCDCPHDGIDEPDTGACSGSVDGGWAGIPAAPAESPKSFQCPQQPDLVLPLSRINDDICDCCDGADEHASGACSDICEQVLAAERAARAKAEADFAAGSAKRTREMKEFGIMLQETVGEIEQLTKTELPRLEGEVATLDAAVRDGKLRYMSGRFGAVKSISDSLAHIGKVATLEEIRNFIISTCHLAGELADVLEHVKGQNRKTCLPLRLAGLDLGFVWEDEKLDDEYTATIRRAETDAGLLNEIAYLMIKNAQANDGTASFGKDDNAVSHHHYHRSHPTPDYGDDDYHYGHDDDEYPYEADDDEGYRYSIEDEEEGKEEKDDGEDNSANAAAGDASGADAKEVRKEGVRNAVAWTRLAASRAPFVSQAKKLKEKIDTLLKATESDGDEDGDGEGDDEEGNTEPESVEQPAIDPQAVQMTRGTLDRRLKHVERGESFATSASVLLDALEQALVKSPKDLKRDMINLAIMTVYHSQLSIGDVADLFYLAMMGPQTDSSSAEEETCSSLYTALCPPTSITRSGVSLPPQTLVEAAKVRCKERSSAAATMCSGDASEIPTSISDGYLGYFVPQLFDEDDPLGGIFEPFSAVSPLVSQVSDMEAGKKDRDSDLSKVRRDIEDLEDKIGGREKPKYGADGELYGIRDSCYTVESGKYEYEVCIFGKASQRDKGQKAGGTHLGNWLGMSKDGETGQRVLKWDNGTTCWNGPARSATVYVTCGTETKLLTADEPSTCEYVFTMESHIACDDAFKKEHGLRNTS